MRLAAVVLVLTILLTPTVAVRLTIRRAHHGPVRPAPPTTYLKRP